MSINFSMREYLSLLPFYSRKFLHIQLFRDYSKTQKWGHIWGEDIKKMLRFQHRSFNGNKGDEEAFYPTPVILTKTLLPFFVSSYLKFSSYIYIYSCITKLLQSQQNFMAHGMFLLYCEELYQKAHKKTYPQTKQ